MPLLIAVIWALVYILAAFVAAAVVYWIAKLVVTYFDGPAILLQVIGAILLLMVLALALTELVPVFRGAVH